MSQKWSLTQITVKLQVSMAMEGRLNRGFQNSYVSKLLAKRSPPICRQSRRHVYIQGGGFQAYNFWRPPWSSEAAESNLVQTKTE